jgi:uncharacterized protein HemX
MDGEQEQKKESPGKVSLFWLIIPALGIGYAVYYFFFRKPEINEKMAKVREAKAVKNSLTQFDNVSEN